MHETEADLNTPDEDETFIPNFVKFYDEIKLDKSTYRGHLNINIDHSKKSKFNV